MQVSSVQVGDGEGEGALWRRAVYGEIHVGGEAPHGGFVRGDVCQQERAGDRRGGEGELCGDLWGDQP